MNKLLFWIMVVIVAIIGIYCFKVVAAKSNIPGLQQFAEVI